jgi:hypothetical protein
VPTIPFQLHTDLRSAPAPLSIPLFVPLLHRRVAEQRVEILSLSRQLLGTDGVTVDSQRGFDIAGVQHQETVFTSTPSETSQLASRKPQR